MNTNQNGLSMPRKSKAKRRRTKKTGISILGVAETAMLLNVASNAMFNNSLMSFLSGPSTGAAAGTYSMTLRELMGQYGSQSTRVYGPTATAAGHAQTYAGAIGHNLRKNWLGAAGQMILIPIAFRFGKQIAKPAINRTNRLLTKAKVAKTVKL